MYLPFAALFEFVPSAALVGIGSLVVFALVGLLIGPDFNNINITAKDNITKPKS